MRTGSSIYFSDSHSALVGIGEDLVAATAHYDGFGAHMNKRHVRMGDFFEELWVATLVRVQSQRP